MGITKDGKLKRRKTGGKPAQYMKKRKFHMGRPAANTKIGETRVHLVRCRGGYIKQRALRVDSGNFGWGAEGITRKTRIMAVVYNPTNNEFVRTNTIVKGEIVSVDATPFKLWYETYYGVAIGRKVVVKKAKSVVKGGDKAPAKTSAPAKVAAKSDASAKAAAPAKSATKTIVKGEKVAKVAKVADAAVKAVAKTAKAAVKAVAKAVTPADAAKPAAKGAKGAIAVKAAAKGAAKQTKKASAAAAKKTLEDAKAGKTAKGMMSAKDLKKVGPIAAKHTVAIANAAPGTLTGVFVDQNASQIVRDKHAKRASTRVLEPLFEEQFATGKLLACISSRPGQHGSADGYLLEGRELEFYIRKTNKKKSAK